MELRRVALERVAPAARVSVVADVWHVVEAAEAAADAELIDDSERQRLEDLAAGDRIDDWHATVAYDDDGPIGYAAIVVARGGDRRSEGELVVAPPARRRGVGAVLADDLVAAATAAEQRGLIVWGRRATEGTLAFGREVGFEVFRSLAVMGRDLDRDLDTIALPPGFALRPYDPPRDDAAVAGVIQAAFRGTPDGGWDVARVVRRRRRSWFRADDVLLVEESGEVVAVHWTRHRGARVGEVHVLAIAPSAQGRRLGPALLRAGLRHLRETDCDEVILWSDERNERAIALYTRDGFRLLWREVAFHRDLAATGTLIG